MREIKFRAMTVSDVTVPNGQRFVYGLLAEINRPAEGIGIMEVGGGERWQVDMNTVGQYTGYKDNSGKEIYEGDIVGYEDCTSTENGLWEATCYGQVTWDEEMAAFEVGGRLSADSYEVFQGGCKILGNIHEAPTLMDELDEF